MQRLAAHKGGIGVGRVLDAVLPDVELCELLVDAELVTIAHGAVDVAGNGVRTLQVRQTDAHDAEGVFHQFAVSSIQRTHIFQSRFVARGMAQATDLQVEHAEERLQRVVEPALLEE